MKKILSVLLIFMLFVTSVPLSAGAKSISDIPSSLEGIDEVKVLEDNENVVTVMGKEGNTIVTMTYDKNTSDITMTSEEINPYARKSVTEENTFNLQLDPNNIEDFEVSNTIEYQGKSYDLEETPNYSEYKQARLAAAIPLVVLLGGSLLNWIISQFASIVIAGVTYVVASAVISELKKKNYDHYLASLRSGKLYIGNSITYAAATTRLKSGDVWSRTNVLAEKVAKGAGGKATAVERHDKTGSKKDDFYWHYHMSSRKGGHSFYGTPVKGKK